MTAARLRPLALAGLAASLAACSIEGRSGEFACAVPEDCTGGRTCEAGWCVLPGGDGDGGGGPVIDAAPGRDAPAPLDGAAAVCSEAICDQCDGDGTCVFLCASAGSCPAAVQCPAGIPCRVVCNAIDSCAGGVDCTLATSCEVDCRKNGACAGPIACGAGRCDVECSARDTCLTGVDCGDSCACATRCSGAGACPLAPECPFASCVEGDGDCTADGADCDACGG